MLPSVGLQRVRPNLATEQQKQQPGGAGGTRVGVGECLLIESERQAGEVTRRVTSHTGKALLLMMAFATTDMPRDFLQQLCAVLVSGFQATKQLK